MSEQNKAQFFLDEFFFSSLSEIPADWCSQVIGMLDVADDIINAKVKSQFKPRLWVTNCFWETTSDSGRQLFEILWDKDFASDPDARDEVLRLQRIIGQSSEFDPPDTERAEEADNCGHGKIRCESYNFGGLLTSRTSATLDVSEYWKSDCHIPIPPDYELKKFYRRWIVYTSQPKQVFYEYSKLAFENTFFHNNLNFNRFHRSYEALLPHIVEHLSFLNDFVQEIFMEYNFEPVRIEAQAKSSSGINISQESPETHKNAKAMKYRYIEIAGEEICCEWHTKIFGIRKEYIFIQD